MNEIIFIGTSFTYGGGLHKHFNKEVVKRYKYKGIEVSPEKNSFPTIVSKNLGIKGRNLGKSGSSIEYLIRNVEEIFYTEDIDKKILVLEYSSWGRSELYSRRLGQYLVANWGPRDGEDVSHRGYESYITTNYEDMMTPDIDYPFLKREMQIYDSYLNRFQDESLELIKRDRYFLNLLYKLKYNNVKYYIICLENPYTVEIENDKVFTDNLIKISYDNEGYNLAEFVNKNTLRISDDVGEDLNEGHPSPKGHEEIANIIIKRLKNDRIY
jgi:hypothetical protein